MKKRDGEIDILHNDSSCGMLVMRGDYTESQILDAAINSGIISDDERKEWENLGEYGRYYQSWFKAVPDGSGQFSTFHHAVDKKLRGAYFASVVERF